jgi:hypothetical protein
MGSKVVFLPYPSVILEGIESTDLRICDVRPNFSSFGNEAVILYISKQPHKVFAVLSTRCNFLAFHLTPGPLESLYNGPSQWIMTDESTINLFQLIGRRSFFVYRRFGEN